MSPGDNTHKKFSSLALLGNKLLTFASTHRGSQTDKGYVLFNFTWIAINVNVQIANWYKKKKIIF